MAYSNVKQAPWKLVRNVLKANVETALVAATQRTEAYRKAKSVAATEDVLVLNDHTNGLFVAVSLLLDAEVNAGITIWGYAVNGPAILIGSVGTIAGGAQVDDDGYFWAESMVPGDEAQAITEIDNSGGVGVVKFDTQGMKYIVIQVTTITQADATGRVKVYVRPW